MTNWVFRGTVLPDGTDGELAVGAGERRALPGRFALPGLVDAHCHVTVAVDDEGPLLGGQDLADKRLAELAQDGIGLLRDVGGERSVTLHLTEKDGRPIVQAAGRFFAPEGRYFPRMHEPVAETELVESVAHEIDDGASWIKIVADFPTFANGKPVPGTKSTQTYAEETVAAVIELAHRRGVRVAAHCNTSVASALIAAGVDSIEHGRDLTFDDLDALAARGGGWTPTLGAMLGPDPSARDDRARAISARLRDLLPYAIERGVHVLTGSDIVSSVPAEIAGLVEHGVSVETALRAASTDAHGYLGVESRDIVTYDDDPRDSPATLRNPAAVVLRG
ncbi:MAG TPA: amidohydrolase family protein, partial [Pseudonocardiaceae bacterium]